MTEPPPVYLPPSRLDSLSTPLPLFSLIADVWALGVLLYKLCYYTTPFEEHGPLAILNVHYKIPSYPVYSANMTNLIGELRRLPFCLVCIY